MPGRSISTLEIELVGNGGAHDRHRDRLLHPDADDLDVDRGALRALEALDDVVEREVVGGGAFDFGDDVAGADAEARGGRAFERRDDGDLVVALGHQDAEAVELPFWRSCMSAYSFGSRKEVCGSSVRSMPSIDE